MSYVVWMDLDKYGAVRHDNGERRAAWADAMADSARATAAYKARNAEYRATYGEDPPEPVMPKPKRAKRVSIRPHTYRGQAGYLVSGERTRVHCISRETAEAVKVAAKVDDWDAVDAALREDAPMIPEAVKRDDNPPKPADSKPTCPRCGRTFRKSGVGLAWHVANNPKCADAGKVA